MEIARAQKEALELKRRNEEVQKTMRDQEKLRDQHECDVTRTDALKKRMELELMKVKELKQKTEHEYEKAKVIHR